MKVKKINFKCLNLILICIFIVFDVSAKNVEKLDINSSFQQVTLESSMPSATPITPQVKNEGLSNSDPTFKKANPQPKKTKSIKGDKIRDKKSPKNKIVDSDKGVKNDFNISQKAKPQQGYELIYQPLKIANYFKESILGSENKMPVPVPGADSLEPRSEFSEVSVQGYSWRAAADSKKTKELQNYLNRQKKFFSKYNEILKSKSFVRGELEKEENLNQWTAIIQLYLIQMQLWIWQENWNKYFEMQNQWFVFLSDYIYEDPGLISFKTVTLFRSMLLDQLESLIYSLAIDWPFHRNNARLNTESAQNNSPTKISPRAQIGLPKKKQSKNQKLMILPEFEHGRKLFIQVPVPWPVDRMVLTEGRKLPPDQQKVIDKLVVQMQKNPYQSLSAILNEMGYNQQHTLWMSFANFWQQSDIQTLQTEMNRIGKLQLFWSYWHLSKFENKDWQDNVLNNVSQSAGEKIDWILIEKKLTEKSQWLFKIPVDYKTGMPMKLSTVTNEIYSIQK